MTEQGISSWRAAAKAIEVRYDDHCLIVVPKTFSTGSRGWYGSSKATLLVGETYYPCQVQMTLTLIGSKKIACLSTALAAQEGPDSFPIEDWRVDTAKQPPEALQVPVNGIAEPNEGAGLAPKKRRGVKKPK